MTALKKPTLTATTLKYIAIIAMVIDHTASAFVSDYYGPLGSVMHFLGRITGPIMFYFIAEGYHHTRNVNKYTARLAVFAVISYVPFILFRYGVLPNPVNFLTFDVIYTLFLGLLALRARHEIQNPFLRWALILLILVLSSWGDWGYFGILCILVFDTYHGEFNYQAFGYSILVFMRILIIFSPLIMLVARGQPPEDITRQLAQCFVTSGMFLPLGLLYFYNGELGSGNKWFFYIFYPLHLLILALLKIMFTLVG